MVVAVASAVYTLYRYRLRQVLKMQSLRNRIAGDLHDEIGSTLSSISLFGEVARKNINNNPAKADNLLEQINEYTSAMMDSMGDIVWTINTRNDSFDNLINRMRAFSSKVMETREVNFVFNAPVTGAIGHLDMTQRKNVYLIFKEAVNNAAKYSCCNKLQVDITDENSLLKVCIKDDGNGFDTGASLANSTSGNGLINMKKRAEELKGNLEINSKAGAGTYIELTVKI
jgi:signal transduction histidine kinase